MSMRFPRRLKDLIPSDVENTSPPQSISESEQNEAKKTIDMQNLTNNTTNTSQRIFPKRSSELPKLDSSDELDESFKNDNLHNCAILNDSFWLSPCKNEQKDGLTMETPAGKLLRHVKGASTADSTESLSFVNQFNKMDLNLSAEPIGDISTQAKEQTTSSKQSANNKLQSIQENVGQEDVDEATELPATNSKRKVLPTQTQLTATKNTTATNAVSAAATEGQFVTPQVRSFSVHRLPRDLCSTKSQKSRSALANEFRSQKVLFQTPITLSRAPLTCLPNDSVTLSLCDTINESGGTPNTVEKSPEKNVTKDVATKTKKSLEGAFSTAKNDADKENVENAKPSQTSSRNLESSLKRTNSSRQSYITINNAEYEIIKKLGCGGSSSVYLAQRKDYEKECALKVVDLQGDPAVVEGYMNETKLLAKLQGNISVVELYDYQLLKKESKLLLVMEKGDSDLQKILQGYTTNLPLYVLMNYLYQMLQAVNYIHQNGVIHSDLKPANFLMVNGRLKLIDFGIASNIATDSTSIIKFSQAGTFNYISPEALTDTSTGTSPIRRNQPKIKISTKSDVWSLGCILYLFLYQKTPFSHIKNIYAKINAISSPTTVVSYPGIPAYYPIMLVHMVKNCLQHNPKERPSCSDLLQYPFHMVIPIQNLAVPAMRSSELAKHTSL